MVAADASTLASQPRCPGEQARPRDLRVLRPPLGQPCPGPAPPGLRAAAPPTPVPTGPRGYCPRERPRPAPSQGSSASCQGQPAPALGAHPEAPPQGWVPASHSGSLRGPDDASPACVDMAEGPSEVHRGRAQGDQEHKPRTAGGPRSWEGRKQILWAGREVQAGQWPEGRRRLWEAARPRAQQLRWRAWRERRWRAHATEVCCA